ncbi:MAG TPA: PocR ligand-binding domain-containing protein [Anaerolineaceae bacterium]|nr:PocR ligand-binding domain-containing protein [Anaerolineaceae bacterium]
MENYLTTKQVQDIFKIDRITVYRMLQDGRLKGVKIGNQWRFPQGELERLLSGDQVEMTDSQEKDTVFPIHCLQTIQDLFTSVSQCSALIIDQDGELVTQISQPGPLSKQLLSTPAGKELCEASWRQIAKQASGRSEVFTCHAGLKYFGSVILVQNKKQGVFLAGEFYPEEVDPDELIETITKTAQQCDIEENVLLSAAHQVKKLSKEEQQHLSSQPQAAATAVESILGERTAFMERLQQIANLTQNL